jgi:DNA polymerase-3 subunit epsilon
MRASLDDVCGCFPTGRHYPGIADRIALVAEVEGLSPHLDATARWAEQKLAVIDFETTGLDPKVDRVIEIGIVCFENGELTAHKNWLVNPGIPVPAQATAVHNITDEQLKDAPPFEKVVAEVRAVLKGHLPVAYNHAFDRAFLHAELDRTGVSRSKAKDLPAFISDLVWVDPLVWARELYKDERGHKLTDMAARLGVALDEAHRAASDAEATGRVLLALASRMPGSYGELIRVQSQYGARQDVDFAMSFRKRG